jgi:ketosteroid isomerase-like protein
VSTPATAIAAQLRTALHAGDTAALAVLLHPDVHFRPLDTAVPATTGVTHALAWYADRRARGFRTLVEELFTYPDSVVLGLRVTRPEPPETADAARPDLLYRLFRLKDGRVVRIRDFADRTHALTTAEAPFRQTA